jgi:hypothetical protein
MRSRDPCDPAESCTTKNFLPRVEARKSLTLKQGKARKRLTDNPTVADFNARPGFA